MTTISLGESIPPYTAHAVSVSLPTWKSNIGYEEGQAWVTSRLTTGYPRFFIHKSIQSFAASIADLHGQPGQQAMLFPNRRAAARCVEFMHKFADPPSVLDGISLVHLVLDESRPEALLLRPLAPTITAVLFHADAFPFAKLYWQHTGDGISSRRAEYCHKLFTEGLLVEEKSEQQLSKTSPPPPPSSRPEVAAPQPSPGMTSCRGPKRYRKTMSPPTTPATPLAQATRSSPALSNGHGSGSAPPTSPAGLASNKAVPAGSGQVEEDESALFLEERFGRNLDLSFVQRAKSAIQRRITGALTTDSDLCLESQQAPAYSSKDGVANTISNNSSTASTTVTREEDVFLLPCGMNAIFNAHRFVLTARADKKQLRSINFGFPYVDTLKILQKFGAGCQFYGHASEAELDDLEARLTAGERFLALFCEFPGNPLLTCPNLTRIRRLADAYDFLVVVDETVGTFANINVMPYADIVVSSLTKIFSGDCNVMGGSLVLNRQGRHYAALLAAADAEFEPDSYWPEDVIFMERNSRDFLARVDRINTNAEALCHVLQASPLVRDIYYPKFVESRANYDTCRIGANTINKGTDGTAGSAGTAASGRVGGYGGLLSVTFHKKEHAVMFYDAVETAKGPSLGTNFTLTSPYVLLAHYQELDWCEKFGVDPSLIRLSIGLEDTTALTNICKTALDAVLAADQKSG